MVAGLDESQSLSNQGSLSTEATVELIPELKSQSLSNQGSLSTEVKASRLHRKFGRNPFLIRAVFRRSRTAKREEGVFVAIPF